MLLLLLLLGLLLLWKCIGMGDMIVLYQTLLLKLLLLLLQLKTGILLLPQLHLLFLQLS